MDSLNYQKILKWLTAVGVLVLILIPDVILGLIGELLHMVFELLMEFLHILFEWLEISLDTVIELLFETGSHETQIIVFYIIMAFVGFGLYRLSRILPKLYRRLHVKTLAFYLYHKNELTVAWHQLTLLNKIKWVGVVISISYIMFFFSF